MSAERIAELEAEVARLTRALSEASIREAELRHLHSKVDELLTAIEAAELDVGHRPIKDIIAELGPLWEAAQ